MRIRISNLLILSMLMTNSLVAAPAEMEGSKSRTSSIYGSVTGPKGPEAGVWVIAETSDLPTRFAKIVVTNEEGRFALPELPTATYKVWSRGYGLLDSESVEASPGDSISLDASAAPSEAQAAQIYPANYWSSMIQVPGASEFPGTGPAGNGISPALESQQHWIAHMIENCQFCHQLGDKTTRTLPDIGDPIAAWDQRIHRSRSPDDVFLDDGMPESRKKRDYGQRMNNLMTQFGRERGLKMFADWTTRIADGAVPPFPSRPAGIERNVVITTWDMGDGRFIHDSSSTDKRNPTVNAGGPVYGYGTFSGMIMALDPKTGTEKQFRLTDAKGEWFINAHPHTGTMDSQGRVWVTDMTQFGGASLAAAGDNPAHCTSSDNSFAKYFPRPSSQARNVSVFNPKTGEDELVPLCFGAHHLSFDWRSERLFFTGSTEVVGWLDVTAWEKAGNAAEALGWCPFVLDTNGDGKITPDRAKWNQQLAGLFGGEGADHGVEEAGGSELDPTKDTRIAGFQYGAGISPKDSSYWGAKYSPLVPSGVLRLETGSNPPETCKTEYFEAPMVDGQYQAYNVRGVDVDIEGIVWVAFGTGAIGKFDRSKCEVLNGPTATGQHCPEGWTIIETPGPKYKNTNVGTDWFYLAFVDNHNTLGLGTGVPIFPNSVGDELLAYLPDDERFVSLRVPYPLGFYPRLVDGRIDDPQAGWRGRGLWATNNLTPLWHQETGEGSTAYAIHFQIRPVPLAE